MNSRIRYIVCVMFLVALLSACGNSNEELYVVGEANNPTQFFGCNLGDDADEVIELLKENKEHKIVVDDKDNPTLVTITGRRKIDPVRWRNTNYDRAVLDMTDDVFTAIELTKTYANKSAISKFVNKHDSDGKSVVTKTDTTRTYVIKGEESRCSIAVNIPERVVTTTYTDNRAWLKPSAWERMVNFVLNPFDNIWSLAMWAVILGLAYLIYTRYAQSIEAIAEEEEGKN